MDEFASGKHRTAARLALCTGLAAALYAVLEHRQDLLPLPGEWKALLTEHKAAAIALLAAGFYALSLFLLPEPEGEAPPDPSDPCGGYQRTG